MTAVSSEIYLRMRLHKGPMTPDLAAKLMAVNDALLDATRAAAKAGNEDLRQSCAQLRNVFEGIPT